MNSSRLVPAFVFFLAAPVVPGPAISYFTNVRDIRISQPELQNYFVVDAEIWQRARADLSDLRIYDGEAQVQYALSEQLGGTSGHEEAAKILNLGNVRGHAEFDLDMGQIGEYDHVRLQLEAKNFVLTASVTGSNDIRGEFSSQLPPSTLYDFTREGLGSNSVLKLPASSFRYLHVKLSTGISPTQVKAATVYNLQETRTAWNVVGVCGASVAKPRTTLLTCEPPPKIPLDRIRFQVNPGEMNFRRTVSISDAQEERVASGEINRVRLNRAATTVVSEEMDVEIAERGSGPLTITIDNGDNPPLVITRVQLLSIERRVYFDPHGKSRLRLYYGDEKLSRPIYDYAQFFRPDPDAAKAELGAGTHNQAYAGRPDERAWSDRHKSALWLAMMLAVAALAVLAVRGLKAHAAG